MAKEKDTLFLAKNWKETFPMIISTTADPKLYNNSSQTPSILSDGMKELCVSWNRNLSHPALSVSKLETKSGDVPTSFRSYSYGV